MSDVQLQKNAVSKTEGKEVMKLTKEQVREIAEYLDCSMNVYINPTTLEMKDMPHPSLGFDDEVWENESEEIDEWDSFILIEIPDSTEAFSFMEDFIEEIEDETEQKILYRAIERRRPFANFKDTVSGLGYKNEWVTFKLKKIEEHVKRCLDASKIVYEE